MILIGTIHFPWATYNNNVKIVKLLIDYVIENKITLKINEKKKKMEIIPLRLVLIIIILKWLNYSLNMLRKQILSWK